MPRMLVAIVLLFAVSMKGFTASLFVAQEARATAGKDYLFIAMMGLPELAITTITNKFHTS